MFLKFMFEFSMEVMFFFVVVRGVKLKMLLPLCSPIDFVLYQGWFKTLRM